MTLNNNCSVFIFHGTSGHPNENWFPWLKEKLEARGCKVFVPQFPTPEGQSLEVWLKVLEGDRRYINMNTIFIGHSLGGIFLLRLLERLPHKVKAAFFVATPIGIKPIQFYDSDLAFSGSLDFKWDEIKSKSDAFVVFHSDNDAYICLDNGKELAKHLGVELSFVPNAGHFNTKAGYLTFEELWKKLEQLV